jgi:hydrogenase-4 component F
MDVLALILVCPIAAVLAAMIPSNRWRPWILPAAAVVHLSLVALILLGGGGPAKATAGQATRNGIAVTTAAAPPIAGAQTVNKVALPDAGGIVISDWLGIDPPGRVVLLLASMLFVACSFYTVGYLRDHMDQLNRVFCVCFLAFLGAMTLVICTNNLGLMWVAMEATTLSSAPLIYFKHTRNSIEATWKYLLLCSVGIALALLGSFFVAYAAIVPGLTPSLRIADLLRHAPAMDKRWLEAGFVLLLVGYGTKMGLAPMHSWLPDAHGESPSPVSAMFSGALISTAFLMVVRSQHILHVAGDGAYASRLLILLGLLSMAFAAIFMVGQKDLKRMLAYSSVEHMGILALGLGIGGMALLGAMLHVLTNGFTKGALFLSVGNIDRAYGSKTIPEVRGAVRRLPLSGMVFLLGFLAITGSPPFGPFISELIILYGTFMAGHFLIAAAFLGLLLIIFIGMGRTVLAATQGSVPVAGRRSHFRDGLLSGLPVLACFLIVLLLGLYIPVRLWRLLHHAADYLEVKP